MPRLPNQLTGLTLGLGAILFWGFSFVGTKLALSEISPIAVVVGRTAVGAAFLLVLMLAQRRALRVPRSCWGAVALAGFLGVFVHNGVQAHALTVTTAVRTGWLVAVVPLWSAILARLFLGEGLSWVRCAGLGVGFGGAALLITGGQLTGFAALPSTRGDLLILATTLNWAVYTVQGRHLLGRLGSLPATTAVFLAGLLMLLPLTAGEQLWTQYSSASSLTIATVLFLGVGCSGVAYLLWYAALERSSAASVAAALYAQPLVTLAGGTMLLGEAVTGTTLWGGVLVLVGVYLVQKGELAPATEGEDDG